MCVSSGLGPDAFDCSGLILRSICDVTGDDVLELAENMRHIRDLWDRASARRYPLCLAKLAIGSVILTRRIYTIGSETISLPGHGGIITNIDPPSFIHADWQAGIVLERPLKTLDTAIGYIALDPVALEATLPRRTITHCYN